MQLLRFLELRAASDSSKLVPITGTYADHWSRALSYFDEGSLWVMEDLR